jgi:hypothetical protein
MDCWVGEELAFLVYSFEQTKNIREPDAREEENE